MLAVGVAEAAARGERAVGRGRGDMRVAAGRGAVGTTMARVMIISGFRIGFRVDIVAMTAVV